MSILLDLARQFGLPMVGVGALLAALYGRRALAWLGRLSGWASIGIVVLLVLGVGSLAGWWDVHVETITTHLRTAGGVLGDLVGTALREVTA
jgi:hypothetical protein